MHARDVDSQIKHENLSGIAPPIVREFELLQAMTRTILEAAPPSIWNGLQIISLTSASILCDPLAVSLLKACYNFTDPE